MSNESSSLQRKDKNTFSTFPYKLWQLLNECTDGAVRWNATGESIVIDKTIFGASTIVGRIFKPIQWSSFVRQLNLYGFHKTPLIHQHNQEPCTCQCHVTTSICYTHEHFRRWNYDNLKLVTRSRKKSRSGFLNIVTENTNDVNGNEPQPVLLATQNYYLENESQELLNWNEVTVPTDMLKESEGLAESDEQNSAFSIDVSVANDRTAHHHFYRVESPMDATSWNDMPSSSKTYCQVRNISQPIPRDEIGSTYLCFSQSGDINARDLTDVLQSIPKVGISADGWESMEVDVEIEYVDFCDSISDNNGTENY